MIFGIPVLCVFAWMAWSVFRMSHLPPLASVAAHCTAYGRGVFMVSPRGFCRLGLLGVVLPARLPRGGLVGRELAGTPRGGQAKGR